MKVCFLCFAALSVVGCGAPEMVDDSTGSLAQQSTELVQTAFWTANLPATIYNTGSSEQQFLTGDFNGDGRTDVFQTYRGWATIPVCRSSGIGWECGNLGATIHNAGSSEQRFLTGDFDGDGRTDIFQTYRGWSSIPVCRSTGIGWECGNLGATLYNAGSSEQQFLTGDFNGDGRTDIFQTYRGWSSIPVCRSSGIGWECGNLGATIHNAGSSEQQFLTGDFNGDGRTDIFQTYRGWGSIPVCLSTGEGWSCSNLPATIHNSGSSEQRFVAADVNGDGRTDIVQTYRGWSSYPVCFSTDSGWSCSNIPAVIYDSGSSEQRFLTGDFNADGKADLFQMFRGWQSIPTSLSL
ncbi:VCBS repeat-containing protein [Archangium sp.]|uniref:FG-GAP repeat domain-containing protein n=1 Tax=Archangium sp. TaxID=1872627 RepID=UPI002D6DD9B2|nr:VCBS repeat-containing protein [Archangium sp.]HYO57957.1 VCBS repeat-containing protein [Archangium sp.]